MKSFNLLSEPTEMLYKQGKSAMADYHLIAAIANIPVDKAKEILVRADNRLAELAKWDMERWLKIAGIGYTRATALVTPCELGRRRMVEQRGKRIKIDCSQDVYNCMKPYLFDEVVEHFYIVLLNRNNQVVKLHKISSGGTHGTLADPKLIFKKALDYLASGLILVHNHPSGNLNPSESDKKLTQRLIEVGKSLEIPVLDHLMFTDASYLSFADEGLI
ncbi:JAB domain-containing protein [Cyclobacterium jeungdonense]|uniref:DNA repair protein RadC n=1 Tax=Cyclobacterium jeungdonense TaxID=708087 RepID=A0ABT8C9A1_9BACT|nr:DNA repair protein RadC [Cyclobacterium jeungdonense]MDN3688604.1 DNA repair protein RadC [Cyclobacterium jeungdonense]